MARRQLIAVSALLTTLLACADGPRDLRMLRVDPGKSRQARAIQGGSVDQGDSAVVAIVIYSRQGMAICTGSLIAPNLVLSAHHCVADVGAASCSSGSFGSTYAPANFAVTTSYSAAANMYNRGQFPSIDNQTWYGARQVWVPGSNICGGDMSLIELSSNVSGTCPIMPRVDQAVSDGEAYRAVGFGITSPYGSSAGTRYAVSGLQVLCSANCGYDFHPSLEWEGGANRSIGTCEGDSGGPALDSAGRVIGTVSRGPAGSCNDTVYESVSGNASWLKQKALTAASDGSYAAAGWVNGGATSDPANGYCSGGSGGTVDPGTGGTGGTDPGTSSTGGSCSNPALTCIDASGQGDFACLDEGTSSGFPAGAPRCSQDADCPANYGCWVTSASASSGQCLENCGASSTGGTSGGTDPGTGSGGTGGSGSCASASLTCTDATGAGDYLCIDEQSSTGFPASAPSCQEDADCPADWGCWVASQNATSGQCLQNCGASSTGGSSGGTDPGTGTVPDPGSGTCTNSALTCVDASGQGDYACIDAASSAGIPAGVASCQQDADCPANNACWSTSASTTSGVCLENCSPTTGSDPGTGGTVPPNPGSSDPGPSDPGTSNPGTTDPGTTGSGGDTGGGSSAGTSGSRSDETQFEDISTRSGPLGCSSSGNAGASMWGGLALLGLWFARRRRAA